MDANTTDFKDTIMPTEDIPPVHHIDYLENQSAGEEVRSPLLTCRDEKETSSLAYSQSGAKTDAENTISVPSAFGDHQMRGSSPTTIQKTEKYSGTKF